MPQYTRLPTDKQRRIRYLNHCLIYGTRNPVDEEKARFSFLLADKTEGVDEIMKVAPTTPYDFEASKEGTKRERQVIFYPLKSELQLRIMRGIKSQLQATLPILNAQYKHDFQVDQDLEWELPYMKADTTFYAPLTLRRGWVDPIPEIVVDFIHSDKHRQESPNVQQYLRTKMEKWIERGSGFLKMLFVVDIRSRDLEPWALSTSTVHHNQDEHSGISIDIFIITKQFTQQLYDAIRIDNDSELEEARIGDAGVNSISVAPVFPGAVNAENKELFEIDIDQIVKAVHTDLNVGERVRNPVTSLD